jgi:lysophospholipase L1-like esterase
MRKEAVLSSLLTVFAVVVAMLLVSPPAASAAPTRIMALGDSITGSPGCWRALLWQRLQNAGQTNVDFVGTLPGQGCGFAYDGENEGHGGFLATNVADQNQLPGWLSATNPNIVLMHFGTNDVWNNRPVATILAAFGKLVDQMRANNPGMRILVAQIIPMNASNCAPCGQRVIDLNAAIPGWAASKSTAQSPVTVVDQWSGFSTAADTYDGVHPNASGDQKMSDRWFQPLVSALGSTPPPTDPPPGTGACVAEIRVVNSWQGAFQADIVVRNNGTAAMNGWTVRFGLATGMSVQQAWNGVVSTTGLNVSVGNVGWNGSVAPTSTTTVGMIINGDPAGWNPNPVC